MAGNGRVVAMPAASQPSTRQAQAAIWTRSGLGGTLNLLFALTRDKFGRDPDCVMATAAGIFGKVKYCPPTLPPCQSDWLPDDRGNRTLVFIW